MEHNRILVVFHWHWQCAANTHMRMQRFEFLQSYIHTDFSSFSLSTSDQRVHFCSAFPSERSLLRLQRRIKGTITLNYWSDFTLVRAPIVQGVTYQFFSFVLFCVRVQQIILNFFRSAISKLRSSRKSNKYQNKNIINKTNKNYDWIIPRQVNSRVWLYFFSQPGSHDDVWLMNINYIVGGISHYNWSRIFCETSSNNAFVYEQRILLCPQKYITHKYQIDFLFVETRAYILEPKCTL